MNARGSFFNDTVTNPILLTFPYDDLVCKGFHLRRRHSDAFFYFVTFDLCCWIPSLLTADIQRHKFVITTHIVVCVPEHDKSLCDWRTPTNFPLIVGKLLQVCSP